MSVDNYFMTGLLFYFFFKQKTSYEMRISDWSSDVCSSDLGLFVVEPVAKEPEAATLGILDAVIVARQPAIVAAAPPFGGDAFGAFVAANRMRLPAPAE